MLNVDKKVFGFKIEGKKFSIKLVKFTQKELELLRSEPLINIVRRVKERSKYKNLSDGQFFEHIRYNRGTTKAIHYILKKDLELRETPKEIEKPQTTPTPTLLPTTESKSSPSLFSRPPPPIPPTFKSKIDPSLVGYLGLKEEDFEKPCYCNQREHDLETDLWFCGHHMRSTITTGNIKRRRVNPNRCRMCEITHSKNETERKAREEERERKRKARKALEEEEKKRKRKERAENRSYRRGSGSGASPSFFHPESIYWR